MSKKGFGKLPCPKCGETTVFALDLEDFSAVRCNDCEEWINVTEIRTFVSQWSRVLNWIDAVPVCKEMNP